MCYILVSSLLVLGSGHIHLIPVGSIFIFLQHARFTIGLWKLNTDGTRVLEDGAPVPTYSNRRQRPCSFQ
jgi:hypothetical protein